MNMFQQEALSKALGGMDLDSIQKIATGSATDVSAQTGNVKAGNKGFLKTTQSAQSTLASQTASISAQTAIVDAELSGKITDAYLKSSGYKKYQDALITQQQDQAKLETLISEAYLKSPAYLKYQSFLINQQKLEEALNNAENKKFITSADAIKNAADSAKLAIDRMFKENALTGLATVAGGIAGNLLTKYLTGPVPVEVVNMGGGGSDISDMLDSDGPKTKNGKPDRRYKANRPSTPKPRGSKMSKIFNSAKNLLPKVNSLVSPKNLLKGAKGLLKGGVASLVGGMVLDSYAENQAEKGNKKTAAGADIASSALSGAGYGAMIGSFIPGVGNVVGAGIGGLLGAGYGLYQNYGAFASPTPAQGAKKPSVAKPPAKGASSVSVPGGATAAKPGQVLSDVQYQTRLQMKMVELLGVNAALLQSIATDGGKDKSINLNGVKLNQSLMVNLRKQMAVNRRETIGAPTGMV
jgi:hypothetical protein